MIRRHDAAGDAGSRRGLLVELLEGQVRDPEDRRGVLLGLRPDAANSRRHILERRPNIPDSQQLVLPPQRDQPLALGAEPLGEEAPNHCTTGL